MDPISTQSVFPTSPMTSVFNGRRFGPMRASSKILALKPGGAGKVRATIGNMRAMSALACSIVTPGLRRAIPSKLKLPRLVLLRSHFKGRSTAGSSQSRK